MEKKMRQELDTLQLEPGALSELRRMAAEASPSIEVEITEAPSPQKSREAMASIPFELVTPQRRTAPEPEHRVRWTVALIALLVAAGGAVAVAASGVLDGEPEAPVAPRP
jgi:hypothetical protein